MFDRKLVIVIVLGLLGVCANCYLGYRTKYGTSDEPYPDFTSQARRNLAREVRKFIGTGYHYGSSSYQGTDCSGLVYAIFQNAIGIELPRSTRELARYGHRINPARLRFGDLVFFRAQKRNRINHVGIYLEHGQFVHSSETSGVVVSDLDDAYYSKLFVMARRVFRN